MPMKRELYPDNWEAIALAVKTKANWTCQTCGKPCRRPGEDWDDEFVPRVPKEWASQLYDQEEDDEFGVMDWPKPGRFVLTVAHINHDPSDCSAGNLIAECSVCHLRRDAELHRINASHTRAIAQTAPGQLSLFEGVGE